MKCPFCEGVMEKGILQSGQIMLWAKKKHYWTLNAWRDGEVELDRNCLVGTALPAWICRACEKVIVDYRKQETRDG